MREGFDYFAQEGGFSKVSVEEVIVGIEMALAAGLIKCYVLSWQPPHQPREVELDKSELVEFGQYFYITPKGRQYLQTEDLKES